MQLQFSFRLVKKSQKDLSEIKAIDISPKKLATIRPSASLEEAISDDCMWGSPHSLRVPISLFRANIVNLYVKNI